METHSVESHLNLDTAEYDRLIRTFIPGYEAMIQATVDWLAALVPPTAKIIDLGGGTGALTLAVAEKLPEASIEIWDIDLKMLVQAQKRLARFKDRVTFREKSFFDELPDCDAVVASLSLHHIAEPKRKEVVYRHICAALRAGGVFLSADALVSEDPKLRDATFERWAAFMGTNGISRDKAFRHFADWSKEDFYLPLSRELSLLAGAGFAHPECFWRGDAVGVVGGRKS